MVTNMVTIMTTVAMTEYDIYIIRQSSLEPLLIGKDSFLVLDLRLDVVGGVGGLGVQGERHACERIDADLSWLRLRC